MRIAIIGAGSWGSAIAWLLADNGHQVSLWARDAQVADAINARHHNPRYLTDIALPASIVATTELDTAIQGAEAVILATPSAATRNTARVLAPLIGNSAVQGGLSNNRNGNLAGGIPVLLLAKGLEIPSAFVSPDNTDSSINSDSAKTSETSETSGASDAPEHSKASGISSASTSGKAPKLLLDVLAEELGAPKRLAVLSGPNHAEEVARGMLAGTVIAAQDNSIAQLFQQALATPSFRVYTSNDCIGVQLCGAAKNVIAIAAGMADGLNLGDNLAAMLMTRGLAEISRLVQACGGQAQTCMGLAGMGDLIVTCASKHSRNRSFGVALAKGTPITEYEASTHMVVEGARACKALPILAASKNIEMPISEHVRAAVWDGLNLREVMNSLLERPYRPEF